MRSLVFMGPIARPDPSVIERALADAGSVEDLLERLGYAPAHRRFLTVSSHGRRLLPHDSLPEDGEIVLSLPMGGG